MFKSINKKDEYFINIAYNEAIKSQMLMKHGACVVHNNCIIGTGCNSYRTQFKDKFIGNSCSCHAEMNALYNCIKTYKSSKKRHNKREEPVQQHTFNKVKRRCEKVGYIIT